MYGAIRKYRVNSNKSDKVVHHIISDFAPQLKGEVPGLLAYNILDVGNGRFATVTICRSREEVHECNEKATEWMKQYLANSILLAKNLSGFLVEVGETLEGICHEVVHDSERFQRLQEPPHHEAVDVELLSPSEVGKRLGMGRSWVYQRIRSGDIPSVRLGNNLKIRLQDLQEYIDRHRRFQQGHE